MTYRETEYTELINSLLRMMSELDDPLLFQEVLRRIWETHSRIPLYPGIVGMCLDKVVIKKDISELTTGEKVAVETAEGKIYGEVEKNHEDKLILKS